jgi:outer membrane protein OmpA-like peptidoglycan-associated protein
MDDIAPQDYQGPAPEELKVLESQKVIDTTKEPLNPTEESRADKDTIGGQNIAKGPPETKSPPVNLDAQQEKLNNPPVVSPFLEQKILIYFKRNSNELPDGSYETLNRIADYLLQKPSARISIKGYSDSTGDYSYNVSVSRFRANTIKTYLVGKGVDAAHIKADGLGPENPIASNSTAEGRRKNRRVEIELTAGD